MARKESSKAALGETPAATQTKVIEAEWSDGADEDSIPGRQDLLVEAIRAVRAALRKEKTPSRTSVGNLVQLLKLHKELFREEERPTHIQLIWNEVDEELYGDG